MVHAGTVDEFIAEATTMKRALQQCSLQYDRQASVAAVSPFTCGQDLSALRELVWSVVREELENVRPTSAHPSATILGDIIRDELRNMTQPLLPMRAEAPALSYAEALRSPQPSTRCRPPSTFLPSPRQFAPAKSYESTFQYDVPRDWIGLDKLLFGLPKHRSLCCGQLPRGD
ncbi:hypothetical protein HPB51_012872 [Rhipicephalus microplus]|uniref:Uncharacterized protein n=1 Tax=Rhipicephalus microplus TaxID=6941 RepID=A0A9J6DVT8_RHIMP|nr:hypothetical protein HPB51_012872 [Rhipicephalus microplus]